MADSSLVFRLFGKDISLGKALKDAGRDADGLNKHLKNLGSDSNLKETSRDVDLLSRGLQSLGSAASSALSIGATALQMTTMSGAALAAAQAVGALAVSLAPAAGIIAAFPAAILGVKAAFGVFKVAIDGVGDAFSAALSGDAAKFQEALEELSPSAQKVAKEFRDLKPTLDDIRSSVQEAMFAPLVGDLKAVSDALAGPVKAGMTGVAAEMGNIGSKIADFARESQTVSTVSTFFAALKQQIADAGNGVTPLAQGIRDFVAATIPAFDGVGNTISNLSTKFGEFLTKAAESGKAIQWIENAKKVFKELGELASNITGILGSVFKAAQLSGIDLLSTLNPLTASLKRFFESAKGQETLTAIFKELNNVATAFRPVVEALGSALAKLAPHIASYLTAVAPGIAAIISSLGDGLAALASALKPVGEAVAEAFASPALKAGLTALGKGLGDALAALAPLLPPLGQLLGIVGQLAGVALTNLAAILGPVISSLSSGLKPVLESVATAWEKMLPLMTPVSEAFGELLGAVVEKLLPPIMELWPALLDNLVPAFVKLGESVTKTLPDFVALGQTIIDELVPSIQPLIPKVAELSVAFAEIVVKLAELTAKAVPEVKKFVENVRNGIQDVKNFFEGLAELPGKVATWFANVQKSISDKLNDAVTVVKGIPEKIKSALGDLGNLLLIAGQQLIQGFVNGIKAKAADAVAAAQGVVNNAVSAAKNLLGISSPSKVFDQIGQMVVTGLTNGINALKGAAATAMSSVTNQVIVTAKTTTGTGSTPGAGGTPSTVTHEIGRLTVEGLIKGLTSEQSKAVQTVNDLISQIKSAFKSQPDVADGLLQFVKGGNASLQALVAERQALVTQLAEAKEAAKKIAGDAKEWASIMGLNLEEGAGVQDVINGLNARVKALKDFANNITQLAKSGLNKETLRQIIQAGPEAGASMAEMLVGADGSEIKAINKAQKQIDKVSKSVGKAGADAMYDVGKKAGEGYLKGLEESLKKVDSLMKNVVNALVKAIKAELKIKSPSRVLMEIGQQTTAGLNLGIQTGGPTVLQTATRLSDTIAKALDPKTTPDPFQTVLRSSLDAGMQKLADVSSLTGDVAGAASAGSGMAGPQYGANAAAASSQKECRIVLDITGGEEEFTRWFRKMVRVKGRGNVQTAFGR